MAYSDFIPRMEKWLTVRGLSAEETLFCTQFVHTGDPAYLVQADSPEEKKNQATDAPVT